MLSFTEAAIDHIHEVLDADDVLRIRVVGGGCAGFSYGMEVQSENQVSEDDTISNDHDFTVVIDKKSDFYLSDTVVDYESSLSQSGFRFSNDKATKTCGCGTSFSCEL
tara:strand:- start:270 stop:593 length:324 start_codon:yes stop_codon:yes gene_type:complete